MSSFNDKDAIKKMGLAGLMVPASTEMYDFVRRASKVINLQFDEKGAPKF
jgi:hypothetical protein